MSNFTWNPRVVSDAMRMAGLGLRAATIYATNCVKEILSVPAPRVRFTDAKGGKFYKAGFKLSDKKRGSMATNPYFANSRIATERTFRFPKLVNGKPAQGPAYMDKLTYQTAPAIKGDPPRKLSGRLRAGTMHEFLFPMKTFEGEDIPTVGRVGTYGSPGKPIKYARRLEFGPGDHSYLRRTFRERWKQIEQVLYDNAGGSAI